MPNAAPEPRGERRTSKQEAFGAAAPGACWVAGSFAPRLGLPHADPELSGRWQLALKQNSLRPTRAAGVRPQLHDRKGYWVRLGVPSRHHRGESLALGVLNEAHAAFVREAPEEADDSQAPERRCGQERDCNDCKLCLQHTHSDTQRWNSLAPRPWRSM